MILGTRKEFVGVLHCLDLLAELLTFSNRFESRKLTDDSSFFQAIHARLMYRRHFTIKMNEDFAISFVPEGSKIETVTKNRKIAVTGQLLQLFISAELLQDFIRYLPTTLVSFSSEVILFIVSLFRRLLINWTFRPRDSSSKSSKIFKIKQKNYLKRLSAFLYFFMLCHICLQKSFSKFFLEWFTPTS
jgi:hypothetical protein